MKKILVLVFLAVMAAGCKSAGHGHKISVVTTLFPLYDFVREIGRERVDVSLLLPPGVESHSYEPTPQDIIGINESRLFVYTGEGMEPWAHDIIKTINNNSLLVIDSSEGVNANMHEETGHENEDGSADRHEDEPHDDGHHHVGTDPHIWLDFEIDMGIADRIADALCRIDPAGRDFYLGNAAEYKGKLLKLDNDYKNMIAGCKGRTIMYGGHFAFGYMAKRYGLRYVSPYAGFSPDVEPTPAAIADMIESIKKEKIEYLFYEELLEPKVANVIKQETGVKLELLHAAHNLSKDEFEQKVSFLKIMEDNLVKLKKAL